MSDCDHINFQALFEATPGLYMAMDTSLRIVACSDAYLSATMTRREDILGKFVFDAFPSNPNDPSNVGKENALVLFASIIQNKVPSSTALQKYDIPRPAALGGGYEVRYWSTVNVPVLNAKNEVAYILMRVEDVTDFVLLKQHHHAQEQHTSELQLCAAQMEGEIYQRTQEIQSQSVELATINQQLSSARDQAIEASNLKSAFVANISHELRTPLTGVLGLTELLLGTVLSSEQLLLAETINESAEALLTIVNDILDISKIEAGKAAVESVPFNLIFLVQDISRLLAEPAQKKSLHLETTIDQSLPQFVIGDPARVRQVLLNLIGNSVKFTEKGQIQVRVKTKSRNDDYITVSFSVTDTGIGIADEKRRFLFVPFSQVDVSNTRKYGGTGLGLSISKSFVDMMGGEIGVESQPNQGSTFWFELPFKIDKHAGAQPLPKSRIFEPSQPVFTGEIILVVEDSPVVQMLVVKQLVNLGLQVHAVSNGYAAMEAVKAMTFDAILMDCQMPELDGFAATRGIRELESNHNKHTTIIAMTAGAMVGDRERCLNEGMDDYISKPFTLQQLCDKLKLWLPVGTSVNPD